MELISRRTSCRTRRREALINADDALKDVFGGKKQVSMFEVTKLVSGHVTHFATQGRERSVSKPLTALYLPAWPHDSIRRQDPHQRRIQGERRSLPSHSFMSKGEV
jgi:hypothetical protein